MPLIQELLNFVPFFTVGVLFVCWGEIRWWRYEAKTWEGQADKAINLAERAHERANDAVSHAQECLALAKDRRELIDAMLHHFKSVA